MGAVEYPLSPRQVLAAIAALGVFVCAWSASAAESKFRPPDAEAKIAALRAAGQNLVPLFVLGDIDEDGVVDQKDLALLKDMVKSGRLWPSRKVSCPAAADLKRNGSVDQRDVARLAEWVKYGKMPTPALSFQSYLPCNFRHFFIAANQSVEPNGDADIRFLDRTLNTGNSTVTVKSGPASVTAAADGRGFRVKAHAQARRGARVLLKIALPKARTYYFTMMIGDLPR